MQLNFVLGTAAELIKVYPVIHLALQQGHPVRVLATGQSRENFLMQYRDLQLPEENLAWLLESSGDLERASSALRWFLRALLIRGFREKALPGYVVVHGDTLSTLVGAWLGRRCGLPVVHIEAGLRSTKLWHPFPEEITRRMVSRLVSVHMAPDARAAQNLRAGWCGRKRNVVCTEGNTLLDAVHLSVQLPAAAGPSDTFALVNIHRFENLNSPERWRKIIAAVVQAANKTRLIFVTHPQTRHKLESDPAARAHLDSARIEIRGRMPFTQFMALLKRSQYLISDGGSNQEECSYLGKPCLILRDATERFEGLDGCCLLTRFEDGLIAKFLENPGAYERPALTTATQSPSQLILRALS